MSDDELRLDGISAGVNIGVFNVQATWKASRKGNADSSKLRELSRKRGELKASFLRAKLSGNLERARVLWKKIEKLDAQAEELEDTARARRLRRE